MAPAEFEITREGLDRFRLILYLVGVEEAQREIDIDIVGVDHQRLSHGTFRFGILPTLFVNQPEGILRIRILRSILTANLPADNASSRFGNTSKRT